MCNLTEQKTNEQKKRNYFIEEINVLAMLLYSNAVVVLLHSLFFCITSVG